MTNIAKTPRYAVQPLRLPVLASAVSRTVSCCAPLLATACLVWSPAAAAEERAAPQEHPPAAVEAVAQRASGSASAADTAGGEDSAAAGSGYIPQAESIELDKPVTVNEAQISVAIPDVDKTTAAADAEGAPVAAPTLVMLGTEVPPQTATRLSWSPAESFEGLASPTPVLVVHGAEEGPTLCLTAAIHGDEINGIEIVRRVLYNIDPDKLSGSVIGVPIVNLQGFRRNSRYLPDRRDLNRYFPGYPQGSSAARIAHSFFHEVIEHCTVLVDLHTGSFDRANLPQLRADLTQPAVVALTQGFGATVVLHSEGAAGTLRRAAVEHGIPAVTLEAGGPMRLEEDEVKHSVKSLHTLLNHLGMMKKSRSWGTREPVYYSSRWVRANTGGILLGNVKLGERVDEGEVLGTVTNPITNVRSEILSPLTGRVLGMALDQVVMPGYAAYHIGITADADEIPVSAAQPAGEALSGGAATSNLSGQASTSGGKASAEAVPNPVEEIFELD